MPLAMGRPRLLMSEMKTSRPARFCFLVMPNSLACLMALMVSAPALARPMILAPGGLGLEQVGGEVGGPRRRVARRAEHLATGGLDHGGGVLLERLAEDVVGGEEVPGVTTLLHDLAAGAVGERPVVVGPVDVVGRALLAGDGGGGGAGEQRDALLLGGHRHDGQRGGGRRPGRRWRRPCPRRTTCGRWWRPRRPCSGGRRSTITTGFPSTLPPKSSAAILAASTDPGPARSE